MLVEINLFKSSNKESNQNNKKINNIKSNIQINVDGTGSIESGLIVQQQKHQFPSMVFLQIGYLQSIQQPNLWK